MMLFWKAIMNVTAMCGLPLARKVIPISPQTLEYTSPMWIQLLPANVLRMGVWDEWPVPAIRRVRWNALDANHDLQCILREGGIPEETIAKFVFTPPPYVPRPGVPVVLMQPDNADCAHITIEEHHAITACLPGHAWIEADNLALRGGRVLVRGDCFVDVLGLKE